jgi:general secretion pathway protein E
MMFDSGKLISGHFPKIERAVFDEVFAESLCQELTLSGVADTSAVARARRAIEQTGERLDQAFVRLGLVPEAKLVEALAHLLGLEVARLEPSEIDASLIQDIPPGFFRSGRLLPFRIRDGSVDVIISDPFNLDPVAALSYRLERPTRCFLTTSTDLDRLIEGVLTPVAVTAEPLTRNDDGIDDDTERLRDLASEAPVIRLVNQVITRAVDESASDIHFESLVSGLRIRFRRNGELETVDTLSVDMRPAVISRLKVLSRLNIAERRLPQDGRIKIAARGREVDLRVSTIPSVYGESVVLRILDRTTVGTELSELGLGPAISKKVFKALERPNGMLLVTGPTGSGKTTTLYAALHRLNDPRLKLFTIEDPVEYQIQGVVQIQIQPKIGLDFATCLRSILRQDPDIILLGEIRDAETARIAIQSALTGHLVLSTLHTNSAAASITRLLDMGVESYLVASTLIGILAQRLVRTLCLECKGDGCAACRHSGFAGRTTIGEYLEITPKIKSLLADGASEQEIERAAVEGGMISMYEDGIAKVREGLTTEAEVLRAVSMA